MKPVINPACHAEYQDFVVSQLVKNPHLLRDADKELKEIATRFFQVDLSFVNEIMQDRYSNLGRSPRLPSDMLRSYMLSLMLKVHSITEWVAMMHRAPAYAVISGFDPSNVPGVGTFYDFFRRLWTSDSPNLSGSVHGTEKPPKRPPKGEKAEPDEEIRVEDIIAQYEENPLSPDQPYALLFKIYNEGFLSKSIDFKLINLDKLYISADGTPVYTAARLRCRRLTPEELEQYPGMENAFFFSQCDCNVGYDSSRLAYFFGYELYVFTVEDDEEKKTLPLFCLLLPASMHDSFCLIHTYYAYQVFLNLQIFEIYLDSAHDNMATYQLFKDDLITPFIALNTRGAKTFEEQGVTFDMNGVPICMAGRKMTRDGVEKKRCRIKYRCPFAWSDIHKCPFCDQCCSTDYGKVVHTPTKDNPRMFNIPPRGTDEWNKKYSSRSASERANKRIKIDYSLEQGHHRCSRYWYCRLYCIMMCIHMDAWELSENALEQALEQAA